MFRQTIQRLSISQSFLLFCLLATVPLLVMGWISLTTALEKQEVAIERHLVIIRQIATLHEKDYFQHLYYTWSDSVRDAAPEIEKALPNTGLWWVEQDGSLVSAQTPPQYDIPLSLQPMAARLMDEKTPYGKELLVNRTLGQSELVLMMATRLPKGTAGGYTGLLKVQKVDYTSLFSFYLDNYPALFYRVYTGDAPKPDHLLLTNIPQPMRVAPAPMYDAMALASGYRSEQKYERINDHAYRSLSVPIHNLQNQPIGLEIFSLDQEQFHPYQKIRVGGYLAFHLICLLLILTAVRTFSKTFIGPVEALSKVSQKVSDGDWSVRVSDANAHGELKQTLDNFNRMLAQLQEQDQLRQSFVANLSHDFRTPLVAQERAMELVLEELREEVARSGKAPESMAELSAMMEGALKNNRHLLQMVNLLLETYQFEAGSLVLNKAPVQLNELVVQCCEQVNPIAHPKNIRLERELAPDLPMMLADADSIKRILLNLLGNALENIPKGSLVQVVTSHEGRTITVEVRDNGPGIAQDDLPHVFERHYSGRHNRRKVGSGLGLYICKMLAEAHQGTIAVESEVGRFTAFRLCFPVYPSQVEAGESISENPLE